MGQLESDEQPRPAARALPRLVVLITETGLRARDACTLPFDPVLTDSAGWPCLRFASSKMRAEHLLPLVHRGPSGDPHPATPPPRAAAPTGRRGCSRHRTPTRNGRSPTRRCAAPSPAGSTDIGLHDETGQPDNGYRAPVSGTPSAPGLINAGRPATRDPTTARPRQPEDDRRLRPAARHHHPRRVRTVLPDPGRRAGPPARLRPAGGAPPTPNGSNTDLARAADPLPNGYCGRPPQQDCPHPNACLTCPDFQTTAEFLDIHRRQRDETTGCSSPPPKPTGGRARRQPSPRPRQPRQDHRRPRSHRRPTMTTALVAAARQRADDTRRRAVEALRRLDAAGEPVTFISVARAAGVSRSWLYRQGDLRAEIERLRTSGSAAPAPPVGSAGIHRVAPTAARSHSRRGHPAQGREPSPPRTGRTAPRTTAR